MSDVTLSYVDAPRLGAIARVAHRSTGIRPAHAAELVAAGLGWRTHASALADLSPPGTTRRVRIDETALRRRADDLGIDGPDLADALGFAVGLIGLDASDGGAGGVGMRVGRLVGRVQVRLGADLAGCHGTAGWAWAASLEPRIVRGPEVSGLDVLIDEARSAHVHGTDAIERRIEAECDRMLVAELPRRFLARPVDRLERDLARVGATGSVPRIQAPSRLAELRRHVPDVVGIRIVQALLDALVVYSDPDRVEFAGHLHLFSSRCLGPIGRLACSDILREARRRALPDRVHPGDLQSMMAGDYVIVGPRGLIHGTTFHASETLPRDVSDDEGIGEASSITACTNSKYSFRILDEADTLELVERAKPDADAKSDGFPEASSIAPGVNTKYFLHTVSDPNRGTHLVTGHGDPDVEAVHKSGSFPGHPLLSSWPYLEMTPDGVREVRTEMASDSAVEPTGSVERGARPSLGGFLSSMARAVGRIGLPRT